MITFSAQPGSGQNFLGIGLGEEDILRLKAGEPITLNLGSVGVGLWSKTEDGGREFLQPRNSRIILFPGNSTEDIGELLRVDMPSASDLDKHSKA